MDGHACSPLGVSPCEAELQELMEQIDIMVSNKKLDWERKMRALETRLDLRDQELANAQTCLDQKGQEVGLLRQKLDSLEKCNLAMTQNYEGQLQALKAQFSKLTSSFEKLRLHQMKQNRFRRKAAPHLRDEMPFDPSDLNQKLEEFRAKSREWDKQEILYQTHLVSVDAQQKVLSEKCDQFQKQAQNYQTELRGSEQGVPAASPALPCLPWEADPGGDASARDNFIIEKLKSAVSEMALSRNKLQDENQKLLQELRMYQRQCQQVIHDGPVEVTECASPNEEANRRLLATQLKAMEAGLSEVKSELQARDELLRATEAERVRLHQELLTAGEQRSAQGDRRLDPCCSHSIKDPERKSQELFPVTPDQPDHDKELGKARSRPIPQGARPSSEQERMRSEISALTAELRQKELTIAAVARRAALLERQLRAEQDAVERTSPWQQSTDPAPRGHSRHTSINTLERENQRLRSDLARLHATGPPWASRDTCAGAGRCACRSCERPGPCEDRCSQDCECRGSKTPPLPLPPTPPKAAASPLLSDEDMFPLSPPDAAFPASLATQHFLLEEERRARELETLLNSHIDELQRRSRCTVSGRARAARHRRA